MRQWNKLLVSMMLCIWLVPAAVFAEQAQPTIDYDEQAEGIVTIHLPTETVDKYKIRISKDEEHYTYDAASYNVFPLQMGDGDYIILMLEQVAGNKYKLIEQAKISYTAQSAEDIYLQSVQNVQWNETMELANKAAALTKDAQSEEAKIAAIYQFVVSQVTYDNEKASRIQSGYIPSAKLTYESKSGICYDYASLFAAMLRSVDIPAKLAMGHTTTVDEYHAWNEVYMKEKDEWVIIDTTYDAAFVNQDGKPSMMKDSDDYVKNRVY